jgi:hypothetical protein
MSLTSQWLQWFGPKPDPSVDLSDTHQLAVSWLQEQRASELYMPGVRCFRLADNHIVCYVILNYYHIKPFFVHVSYVWRCPPRCRCRKPATAYQELFELASFNKEEVMAALKAIPLKQ